MTQSPIPLVSIGLPVYNEAANIDAALSALRAQDYPRLEIIVCDNASTDETLAVCRRHAADDPRVRIDEAPANRGITANFRHALDLAKGEYFMWASGHDLWSSGLVSECVALLDAHPRASLAYASSCWIDPDDEPLARESGWTDTRGMSAAARFFTIFWGNMHPVLGVMRTSRLRECGPFPAVVGGDLVLLAALALRGDFLHARFSLWSRRDQREETGYAQKLRRYASYSFGVTRSWLGRAMPLMGLPIALASVAWRSPLRLLDRALILFALLPALALRYVVGRRAGD